MDGASVFDEDSVVSSGDRFARGGVGRGDVG